MQFEKKIEELQREIENLKKAITWYQDTYEKRSLPGVIKDRVLKQLRKYRAFFKTRVIDKLHFPYIYKLRSILVKDGLRQKVCCTIVNYNCNENALRLKKSLSRYFSTVVIDSGSKVKNRKFINLPNIYYSGLYNHAVGMAQEKKYEYLFFICSDVVFEDTEIDKMITSLRKLDLEKIGIYSPSSSGRSHYQCKQQASGKLRSVDFAEGFVFFANMKLLNRISFIDTNLNLLGWGIDVVQGYYCKLMQLLCLVDDRVTVYHPEDTGYSSTRAEDQMYDYFASLEHGEAIRDFHLTRVDLIRKGLQNGLKISVIVPCYNQGAYMEETVLSVFSQTYSNYEILLINDGSTDNTHEIAEKLSGQFSQIKYIRQENKGLGATRNTGLQHTTGDLVQFLDSDDTLSINKFNTAIKKFMTGEPVDIVYSAYLCYEDGNRENTWTYSRVELKGDPLTDLIQEWEKDLSIPVHCFLLSRHIIGDTLFDTSLPNHEDWAFHLSIAAKQPHYIFTPEATAYYRIKKVAMSQDKDKMKKGKNQCLSNMIASKKFNSDSIQNLYKRLDYKLVVGIISCKKNAVKVDSIRKTWAKELMDNGVPYYFVMGDPTLTEVRLDGDILYVPCSDHYEDLPRKMYNFYEYVYHSTQTEYVYKIDDDCYLNTENLFSTQFWNYNYFGKTVATDEVDLNRTWHFGKCSDARLNETPYPGDYIGPWCGGGFGYFLSRQSLENVVAMREFIFNELYEDKAIGDALRIKGILPEENPEYQTLDIQKFNADLGSQDGFRDLVDHLAEHIDNFEVIIELRKDFHYFEINTKKRYVDTIKKSLGRRQKV